ncbi:MAG: hypothetical protein DRO88_09530 [Promethearchaeia archaeon]|nr:MAG: hypothetical protein DRO88_09530 [Candidatus Lokiarchaeia archaeon]
MFSVSKNKCVGCGICETECLNEAIKVDLASGIAVIDKDRCSECYLCIEVCPQNAIKVIQKSLIIAIGTDDEKTIKPDDHFGMSKYFQIWLYSDGQLELLETRENSKYEEDETRIHGDPNKVKATSSILKGVDVMLGKMMGANIQRLKNKFIPTITREPLIKNALTIIKENINEIMEEYEKQERKGIILI